MQTARYLLVLSFFLACLPLARAEQATMSGQDLQAMSDLELMTRLKGAAPQSVVEVFHRLRPPFNLSGPAIAAGAAAMADDKFLNDSVDFNARELDRLTKELSKLGLVAATSVANFILLRFAQSVAAAQ